MTNSMLATPNSGENESADEVSFDASESGRHRPGGHPHPAHMLTAGIAVGSLALAGYAALGSQGDDTEQLVASINQGVPMIADSAASSLEGGALSDIAEDSGRVSQGLREISSVHSVQEAGAESAKVAVEQVKKAEAERQAAAEAEAAAAEEAAAEEAAAEEAAAQERSAENPSASRSSARDGTDDVDGSASGDAPAPVSSGDPRSTARSMLSNYGWSSDQFGCLDSLWNKESGWDPSASNPSSGAYGIPQSLPGSKMASAGSDWQTNAATQIAWGLGYIDDRYGSPCSAWSHSQANNWY